MIDDLDAALQGPLGVGRVNNIADLTASGPHARYMREPALRLALHFDIEPTFLVLDPLLGTLGVVELVMPEKKRMNEVSALVRRHVDRATYLRHLLLRNQKTEPEKRPLSVELVFLTAEPVSGVLDAIGATLRSLLQDTDSLFHVGIGILCHGREGAHFEKQLRRAFPWLLTATRSWLGSKRANADLTVNAAPRALRQLTLRNYRLAGTREISLANTRVHLMHGANGSGKSSIAEALEIVTCGTVERLILSSADRYDAVIKNATSTDPASVQLRWIDSENRIVDDKVRTVGEKGISEPLDATIPVGSFRLDQALMDRLIGRTTHERAKMFMDAFFPEAAQSRADYELASLAHQKAMSKIDALVERLEAAKRSLLDLKDYRTSGAAPGAEPLPTVLNQWLEQITLLDLLQRQRVVRATIEAAQRAGWSPTDERAAAVVKSLAGESDVTRIQELEFQAKSAVDWLQSQLASFTASEMAPASPAFTVSRTTVDVLNAVGRYLFTTDVIESLGMLGDKVAAVINAGDAPTYGTVVIGVAKWTETIVKDIDLMIEACKTMNVHDDTPPAWPGKSLCIEYDEARRTHAARLGVGGELSKNFIDKLRPDNGVTGEFDGSLIAAVNEVMALMTPARWAYHDILLPSNLVGGSVGVGMHLDTETATRSGGTPAGPIRAELHLNTAELNLFTVALFMLCVGRVRKPLNLLVFDDPLQNMDELTSTALARGLAKIIRLWADLGRKEELLILFHGYNELERFSAEIAAADYRLPWLSPSSTPLKVTVEPRETGGDVLGVQEFARMLPELRG